MLFVNARKSANPNESRSKPALLRERFRRELIGRLRFPQGILKFSRRRIESWIFPSRVSHCEFKSPSREGKTNQSSWVGIDIEDAGSVLARHNTCLENARVSRRREIALNKHHGTSTKSRGDDRGRERESFCAASRLLLGCFPRRLASSTDRFMDSSFHK